MAQEWLLWTTLMLTSFAVQVVKEKLIWEAKATILLSKWLHASSIKCVWWKLVNVWLLLNSSYQSLSILHTTLKPIITFVVEYWTHCIHVFLFCSLLYLKGWLYSDSSHLPGHEWLKDCLMNKFNHLLHSLVPCCSRSPSYNRQIRPTLDPQTLSIRVSPNSTSIPGTQPFNSSSYIYPSIVINPAGDEAPEWMADLASAGFQGVKMTLQLVERATDIFLPLKLTVAGLLGVIDVVEVCDF